MTEPKPTEPQSRALSVDIAQALPNLASIPLVGIATGGLFPLIALDLDQLGFGEGVVGLATSLYYAGSFLGALSFGLLTQGWPLRRAFALAAFGLAVTTTLMALTTDPVLWTVLRFIGGYCLGGLYVITDGWITAVAVRANRGRVFGVYETMRLGAVSLGPTLILLGSTQHGFGIVAACYLASIMPLWFGREPEAVAPKKSHFGQLLETTRTSPLPLLICLCGGACNATFYGLGALYARSIGFDDVAIASFTAIVLFAPIVSEVPAGYVSDRFGRMRMTIVLGLVATLMGGILIANSAPDFVSVLAPAFIFGMMTVPLYGLALTHMVDRSSASGASVASAGMVFYNTGGALAPYAAGAAMEWVGPSGLYVVLSGLAGLAVVAAVSVRVADALRRRRG